MDKDLSHLPAMVWGNTNEESGIKAFEKRMGGQVTKCGLHVSRSHPHIGKNYLLMFSKYLLPSCELGHS